MKTEISRTPIALVRRAGLRVEVGACAEHRGRSTRSERPQIRKRNQPRHPLLETTRVDGVKAPQHRGTPRSYHLVALLDLVAVVVLLVVVIERIVLDGADVHDVVAVGHRLRAAAGAARALF